VAILRAHQICDLSKLFGRASSKTLKISGNPWPAQRPSGAMGTTQRLTTSDGFLGESDDVQPLDVVGGAPEL
jgi:hypothetical protein